MRASDRGSPGRWPSWEVIPARDPLPAVPSDQPGARYGLIVHDGGAASIGIDFCSRCGQRLLDSRRDRWFDETERRGIDPSKDDVLAEFQDGARLGPPCQG
ncbi:DUF6980 family protein [Kitasatospora sp. NPDC101447]|uniref:DUF6980 family protein n=1 Tax=Kitasatospora sp. NPDC101447 TaxID=3364102 RepID=UPI003810D705